MLVVIALAFYFLPTGQTVPLQWLIPCIVGSIVLTSGQIKSFSPNLMLSSLILVFGLLFLGAGKMTVAPLLGVPVISAIQLALNLILVALLLGFSMTAMWLGHWYLTQPKLPIDELRRVTLALAALLLARLLMASYTGVIRLWPMSEIELYRFLATSTGIFLLMRAAWGLVMPLGLVWMVWKTVQIRSTQSATGILYVLLLSILAGETLSLYLMFHDGWIL